ncbi:DNA-directed RNA polymerase subunit beta' [Desulfurobacterium thermolithotrophum DSM 11699]|uniref:DNA-directed RNA polymerase subunit beta' n=1 Tax=Desulfurobacterium thermolithotrophum (strain DSM 11699 / BSA) TaxID=868864 RepID=F0S105_DESTD|nr:DNA-directed RNA polymerase subunit beta' [Desulfurobacterium thermolithotrophum]ADY72809.1 DNA-directed RNA polymerase subunit beta' [Desulfurobacterium thermolithotrophum DSM 11699]
MKKEIVFSEEPKTFDFDAIEIGLASPEKIREWSHGEVKLPETLNYRTLKPERDGLFCARIFGPIRDWECLCGKYRGSKYAGVVCDRCGVEVTLSKERRKRFGHIELAAPCTHIWYVKSVPSKIGALLGLSVREVERVVYFESYIVLDPGDEEETGLKKFQILTEEEYREKVEELGEDAFEVGIGADGIKEALKRVDLEELAEELREEIRMYSGEISSINADLQKRLPNVFKTAVETLSYYTGLSEDTIVGIVKNVLVVVTDPGDSNLEKGQIIEYNEYKVLKDKVNIEVEKGGRALDWYVDFLVEQGKIQSKELLKEEIRRATRKDTTEAKLKKLVRRLRVVESFLNSDNKPEWMVLEVLPVLPPELRPLVPLEGGRFATSDLNDLYRRVINRNNRLKRLIELDAPDIIIRNEKRMLQEAVDTLIDNGRRGRPVKSSKGHPLKSLSDVLRGKQGRFRQNLLGKRVDYSGRAVIVIGPELKMHQCGLPKVMALELFKPFIYRRLEEKGYANTVKQAKKMVERQEPEVWECLEEVIKEHPVLLNRAPTLHRVSIQAFEPVLVEGKAIKLHPLVCTAFNADFDGDQMAVHVPLSLEAQLEAYTLMLSTQNILSPAHGKPLAVPSQDMVLGLYYMTLEKSGAKGEGKVFSSIDEVLKALDLGEVELHAKIKVRIPENKTESGKPEIITTTVGRVKFNTLLPENYPFVNKVMTKKAVAELIGDIHKKLGNEVTVDMLDRIKEAGFIQATLGGLSISIDDLHIPPSKKELIEKAKKEVAEIEEGYRKGLLSKDERYNKIVDIWTRVTEQLTKDMMEYMKSHDLNSRGRLPNDGTFNPVFMMLQSGARGSQTQIRQLAGMRGLMAKPSGEIIETPIISNFREGLTVLEYFISTHGARKGLADTALKTADAGYLTRRLADVAQDVIVTMEDCGCDDGIEVSALIEAGEIVIPLSKRIAGRYAAEDIVDPVTGEILVKKDEKITDETAERIEDLGIDTVKIRSVLTCRAPFGVCAKCYGRDLARRRPVQIGESVGIIAAQSIGEPGTQLTMRTFHIGGIAMRGAEASEYRAKHDGIVRIFDVNTITDKEGNIIVINRAGKIAVVDEKNGKHLERYDLPYAAVLKVKDGDKVQKGQILAEWDPHAIPILALRNGTVKYKDILPGITVSETEPVVLEYRTLPYEPTIELLDENGEVIDFYPLPVGARIMVKEGEKVEIGAQLARLPRRIGGTKDITGGLPRVAELFEARRPKDTAILAEISGKVYVETEKNKKKITILDPETGVKREYEVPKGKYIYVRTGDFVKAGEPLTDGQLNPHDILAILGERAVARFLLDEIQSVYRAQGVDINDKHFEVIIKKMLSKVRIEDSGDSNFLVEEVVDREEFEKVREQLFKEGKKPPKAKPVLTGITKAALSTDSFISAASFQETTRVLSEAAIAGKKDYLRGLKENVIIGRLIPAGTGRKEYRKVTWDYCEKVKENQ